MVGETTAIHLVAERSGLVEDVGGFLLEVLVLRAIATDHWVLLERVHAELHLVWVVLQMLLGEEALAQVAGL